MSERRARLRVARSEGSSGAAVVAHRRNGFVRFAACISAGPWRASSGVRRCSDAAKEGQAQHPRASPSQRRRQTRCQQRPRRGPRRYLPPARGSHLQSRETKEGRASENARNDASADKGEGRQAG